MPSIEVLGVGKKGQRATRIIAALDKLPDELRKEIAIKFDLVCPETLDGERAPYAKIHCSVETKDDQIRKVANTLISLIDVEAYNAKGKMAFHEKSDSFIFRRGCFKVLPKRYIVISKKDDCNYRAILWPEEVGFESRRPEAAIGQLIKAFPDLFSLSEATADGIKFNYDELAKQLAVQLFIAKMAGLQPEIEIKQENKPYISSAGDLYSNKLRHNWVRSLPDFIPTCLLSAEEE